MRRIRIDPSKYPKKANESWWIVHPNTHGSEFRIPSGAMTLCLESLEDAFKQNVVYNVISTDNYNGWVTVEALGDLYEMPQYLFARHFDAESFVVGRGPLDIDSAKPFNYKPTIPVKPEQLELFKD